VVTPTGSGAAGDAVTSKAGTKAGATILGRRHSFPTGRRSTFSYRGTSEASMFTSSSDDSSMRRQRLLMVWRRKELIEIGQILWR
jgi:hypothetical protein